MDESQPLETAQAVPVMLAIFGAWGGTFNHLREVRMGNSKFSWKWLLFDVITAYFIAVITFILVAGFDSSWPAGGLAGVAAYMGPRLILVTMTVYELAVSKKADVSEEYKDANKSKKNSN